jgi:hypothetical protein
MTLFSDLQTGALRGSTSPLDSLAEIEPLTLPPTEGLAEGIITKLNRGHEIDAQTQTLDQSGTFSVNGGSTAFTINPFTQMLVLPQMRPAKERFNAMQKWEGFVVGVKDDTFIARLTPIVGEGQDQEAEIYLDEIEEGDQSLIEPGAVFYWSIGYLDRPSGRIRASIIRFRRLPGWDQRKLDAAKVKAVELKSLLDDD